MRKPLIAVLSWGMLATVVGVQALLPHAQARTSYPDAGSTEERALLVVMRDHLQKSRELSRSGQLGQARAQLTEAVLIVKGGLGADHPIMQVLSREAHLLNETAQTLSKGSSGSAPLGG